jgi:hypothetical protein
VDDATDRFRESSDQLGRWITERVIVDDSARARIKDVYADYLGWCDDESEKPLSKNALNDALKDVGATRSKNDNARIWKGIGLDDRGPTQRDKTTGHGTSLRATSSNARKKNRLTKKASRVPPDAPSRENPPPRQNPFTAHATRAHTKTNNRRK